MDSEKRPYPPVSPEMIEAAIEAARTSSNMIAEAFVEMKGGPEIVKKMIDAALEAEKLDRPAQVGGTIFGVGVSARLVIGRAQREHEYNTTPAARLDRLRRLGMFLNIVRGIRDGKQPPTK